jgi:hypothetical protein
MKVRIRLRDFSSKITICDFANMFGILFMSVLRILEANLYMLQIATKFVPCLLSEQQKENCVSTWQGPLLERVPELISKVIVADKTEGGIKRKETD